MKTSEMTAEIARAVWAYDPITGILRWRRRAGRALAGTVAGTLDPSGYLRVGYDHANFWVHRLCWLIATGGSPKRIDHRDLSRSNNRLLNLRAATQSQNGANRLAPANNKTGAKGVLRSGEKWQARITKSGVFCHLGTFETKEAAAAAYARAALKHYGEFARS